MDRLQFSQSIKNINIINMIKNYFDEVMILYNLMGKLNYTSISGNIDNNIIYFSINFKTNQDAQSMHKIINNTNITIYNTIYKAQTTFVNEILNISLKQI